MTLKGVVLQLLRHDHHRQSPRPSKLLFHDELRFRSKFQGPKEEWTLFVLTNAPEDRQKELKGAFKKAGENLGIDVKFSDAADASDAKRVILLYTGFFKIEENRKLVAETAEKLMSQRDRTSDKENPTPAFLLYSTDSGTSDDMTKHMNEAKVHMKGAVGESQCEKIFTPLWSEWPTVSSLQTVAAEEQLLGELRSSSSAKTIKAASGRTELCGLSWPRKSTAIEPT